MVTLLEQGLRQVAADRFVRVIRPALVTRGVEPIEAALLAERTVVVLHVALDTWLDAAVDQPMADVVTACFFRLRGVLGPSPDRGGRPLTPQS